MSIEILHNPSLSKRTTLGIGGTAEVEMVVREAEELDEVSEFLMTRTLRPFVIGEGSNLLAPDEHLDLALIRAATAPGPHRVERRNGMLITRCGAAHRLPGLLGCAQMAGLSGLDPLTGIPGSVGGAVAMNAGSYDTEFGDLVTRVRIWTPAGGLRLVDADECDFGYRSFSCGQGEGKVVIWEVELALAELDAAKVRSGMKQFYDKKKTSQPVTARSAGCIFKNTEDEPAGKLLDQAGMKGKQVGAMKFSELHANFLVNTGGGTAAQAMELIDMGREAVREQFGITLELEVITL